MSNRKNFRKRAAADSDEEDSGATSAVVQKAKAPAAGPLVASSAKTKSREDTFYESSRTVVPSIGKDNGATAPIYEDEDGPKAPGGGSEAAGAGGKLYTGAANYQKYIEKREVMDRKASSIGPIKAPTNVRLTCRFDYQPDICKDYKETGYCGFGDACKFMHDRGDYKAGWELDRDWKAEEEKKKLNAALVEMESGGGAAAEEEDDGLPFACAICRGPFCRPVETKCGHYFCEGCALSHYGKNRRCFICNEQTYGIFNTAMKLESKIKRLKARSQAAEGGGGDGGPGGTTGKGGKAGKAGGGGGGDDDDDDDDVDLSKYAAGAADGSFKADIGWQIPGNTFQKGKDVLGWGT